MSPTHSTLIPLSSICDHCKLNNAGADLVEQRGLLRRGVDGVLLPRRGRPLQPRPGVQRRLSAPSAQEPPPGPRGQVSGRKEDKIN